MNENKLKYSTTYLVNNYENDLTIHLVNQIIQRSFENQISKLNSVHNLAKCIIVDNTSNGGKCRKKFFKT